MTRTPVKSSSIASIGHDGEHLTVEFNSGRLYHFANVPPAVHQQVMKADSVGKAFNALVRGKFDHSEITERS